MKRFISRILYMCIISIVCFLLLGYYLEYQFSRDLSNKFTWQFNIENKRFDNAIIGSSRAMNMININQIDSALMTKSINLGLGGADFRILYMVLYSFIDIQNNQLKRVFIQVDPFMIYKEKEYNKPTYDHFFYSLSNHSDISNCLKKQNKIWMYYNFPIIKFIEFNKVFNLTHFVRSFSKTSKFNKSKGSDLVYKHPVFKPKIIDTIVQREINNEEIKYLDQILELLSNQNVDVVLYTAPVYSYQESYFPSYPEFENQMKVITENYGFRYLDFATLYNNNIELYKDMIHLNYKGTIEFTRFLIENGHFENNVLGYRK